MTIDEIAATFEMLDDWEARYTLLLDLGKKLEPMPDAAKSETTKVRGCMSQVWLDHQVQDGKLSFRGDSDAHIVRGLIALLFSMVQQQSAETILSLDIPGTFAKLGLDNHISMNRRNGFYAMTERIKAMAQSEAARSA